MTNEKLKKDFSNLRNEMIDHINSLDKRINSYKEDEDIFSKDFVRMQKDLIFNLGKICVSESKKPLLINNNNYTVYGSKLVIDDLNNDSGLIHWSNFKDNQFFHSKNDLRFNIIFVSNEHKIVIFE